MLVDLEGGHGGLERLGASCLIGGKRALGLKVGELALVEGGVTQEDVDTGVELLADHGGNGDHGHASVVELLHPDGLHVVGGLALAEAERIPSVVSGDVSVLQEE